MGLKVIISAYACEPGRSSEPGVGWNVVRELAARHELWVLTRANNEPAIRAAGEAWVERVHWVFIDLSPRFQRWKKSSLGLKGYYLLWQRLARKAAAELLERQEIDLIHHLTFGHFLPPSPLARLGKPFVAGPLGGGEWMPPSLFASSSFRVRRLEWSRNALRALAARSSAIHNSYRSTVCLAATSHTAEVLRSLGAAKVSVLHQSGLSDAEIGRFAAMAEAPPAAAGPLKLVAASRLVHWKGLDLAIDALALALGRGLDVRLEILQEGPERARLEQQVQRLGLQERVVFRGRLPQLDDVYQRLLQADALIHPAFHEAFGQACLEALALGLPVICLDWAGPGTIVDSSCGYKVAPADRATVVAGLAEAMSAALADRGRRAEMAAAGKYRAATQFRWRSVAEGIEAAWRAAGEIAEKNAG